MAFAVNSKINLVNPSSFGMFTTTRLLYSGPAVQNFRGLAGQNATMLPSAKRFFASRKDEDSSDFEAEGNRGKGGQKAEFGKTVYNQNLRAEDVF